ncbi:MAG: S1 family peptidase, partial [Bdellovibrionales bacterium]|nr:S1 family peptidase [Bdellovibrionales bacterium]
SVGSLFRIDVKLEAREVSGRKAVHGSSQSGRCTQSLISPTRILTNAHCLKAGAKAGDAVTSTYAIFPATSAKYDPAGVVRAVERIKVLSVVRVSNFDRAAKMSPDFAILELERPVTTRPVLPIAQREFKDGDRYQVVAMWPLKDYSEHPDPTKRKVTPVGALQRRYACKALLKTVITSFFKDGSDPFFALFGCPAPGGNSGSPILNPAGEIIGILASGPEKMVEAETTDSVAKYTSTETYEKYKEVMSRPDITPRFWLSGTSAKCILHPELCRDAVISEKQEDLQSTEDQKYFEAQMDAIFQDLLGKINASPSGPAFFDSFGDETRGKFPKLEIEVKTEIQCPSYAYFTNLQKSLGLRPEQGFEAKVPQHTRKWIIRSAIGPEWRYEFGVGPLPEVSERMLSVRVVPEAGKPTRVFEIGSSGEARLLGSLCAAE